MWAKKEQEKNEEAGNIPTSVWYVVIERIVEYDFWD